MPRKSAVLPAWAWKRSRPITRTWRFRLYDDHSRPHAGCPRRRIRPPARLRPRARDGAPGLRCLFDLQRLAARPAELRAGYPLSGVPAPPAGPLVPPGDPAHHGRARLEPAPLLGGRAALAAPDPRA